MSKAPKPSEPAKRGRPSVYDRAIADTILGRIANGESLKSICRADDLPSDATFRAWVIDDVDGISSRSTRAYDIGHDAIADECMEIADIEEDVVRAKLKIDTRLRLLGKWSKKYADKVSVDQTTNVPELAKTVSVLDEILGLLAAK